MLVFESRNGRGGDGGLDRVIQRKVGETVKEDA